MDREERIQRQMDFIIGQQAQFSIDIEKLQETIGGTHESIGKIEDVVLRLANATVERFERDEEKITLLIDSQRETDQKIKELTGAQKDTDERLNSVIYMFEKFISRDMNGNSKD